MKGIQFPIFKTKIAGQTQVFSLDDPIERQKYFKAKAGDEIEKLREYLRTNTFVAFLLGKKNSGKGTYSKLFAEAVGAEHVRHISVGDVVRAVHADLLNKLKRDELLHFLQKKYRGFLPFKSAIDALLNRSTTALLPTELIITIVEREISKAEHKAVFIDGFPRSLDQVSYSLYFRELIGYRDDPDFFVFIDVPEAVIDERLKYRVICPICKVPRNLKLLRTRDIGYDELKKQFFLMCDNPACGKSRMVSKEGDELGIEAIRDRIEIDDTVMRTLMSLEGVPKIFLRNSIPVKNKKDNVDDYEITPSYKYVWHSQDKKVEVIEEPWTIKDEDGVECYSLLPPPVVLSLIKQIVKVLGL